MDYLHLIITDIVFETSEPIALHFVDQDVVAFCSYGNQLSSTELVDISLSLPIQVDVHGEAILDDKGHFIPDWDYMESYIHAMEKQVIADVVDYKDSMITTAKELIYV